MDNWQPIETCPYDIPVLVNNIREKSGYAKDPKTPRVMERSICLGKEGFSLVGSCGCNDDWVDPTHWMPLPQPPNDQPATSPSILFALVQAFNHMNGDYVDDVWGRDLKYLEDAIKTLDPNFVIERYKENS